MGWVVSFTPLPLYPWRKFHDTHWIGDRVGPSAGLDAIENRTRAIQPVAYCYADWAFLALHLWLFSQSITVINFTWSKTVIIEPCLAQPQWFRAPWHCNTRCVLFRHGLQLGCLMIKSALYFGNVLVEYWWQWMRSHHNTMERMRRKRDNLHIYIYKKFPLQGMNS
jgi:hypothetical protein